MRNKRVEVNYWVLRRDITSTKTEIVRLLEYEPDPAGRGGFEDHCSIPWPTLRELVRRYELLADYTPDPQVLLVEDGG